jgi:hypothetical protein
VSFRRTGGGVDLGVIDKIERCLVEVAPFVRVRIEEETFGAAFHY